MRIRLEQEGSGEISLMNVLPVQARFTKVKKNSAPLGGAFVVELHEERGIGVKGV
jgi:hypothetical protein